MFILLLFTTVCLRCCRRKGCAKPPLYRLRPFHFGILVGTHLQDLEFVNVGPQLITAPDGTQQSYLITCDQDAGTMGSTWACWPSAAQRVCAVQTGTGVVFRHAAHLVSQYGHPGPDSLLSRKQTMKSAYISCAMDLIFAGPRSNNHRPYVMVGLNPMINLSSNDNDYLKL
jgi:hypothetical protein